MKEIILTVPHNTKEFIQASMRWHQMISSFKEDTPNNEVHVFIKEEYSNATEQDLYAGVNLYGVDEQTILSPKGIAHIAKSGAPYSAVFDYVVYNIKDKHTQESILEALNEEGIKHNYNFWFTTLPTARSLELMIAIGSDPSYLLNNIMGYYNTERDDECIDLLKVVLSNEGNANISGLYNIPSFLPTNAIDLLIETGLSINLVFNAAAGAQSLDNQSRLIKIAQNHGFSEQDCDKYFFSLNSLTTDFIDTLINNNLISAQKILQKIISLTTTEYCQETTNFIKSQSLIEKQAALIKHTASKGAQIEEVTFYTPYFVQDHSQLIIDLCADLNSFPWDFGSIPKQTIELLIEKGVDPDKLVKAIYDLSIPKYNDQLNTHESATINDHLEELIGIAVKYHFDLNNYFTEQLATKYSYISLSGEMVPIVPSAEILKLLNQSKLVTADVLLQYAYEHNDLNLLKEAISKGAIIPLNEASNLLNKFISQGNYALAEYFVFELGIHDIDPRVYIVAVLSSDLENAQYIIKKFAQFFDRATCIELMRAAGASIHNIIIVSDIYDLYCAYGKNNSDLSPSAKMLLNPDIELTADQLQDQDFYIRKSDRKYIILIKLSIKI